VVVFGLVVVFVAVAVAVAVADTNIRTFAG